MQASRVISDGGSEATGAQGINLSQLLALIDPSDQYIRVQLPQSYHPRSPCSQASRAIMLAVKTCRTCATYLHNSCSHTVCHLQTSATLFPTTWLTLAQSSDIFGVVKENVQNCGAECVAQVPQVVLHIDVASLNRLIGLELFHHLVKMLTQ